MPDPEIMDAIVQMLRTHKCANESLRAETPIEELQIDSIQMTGFVLDLEERFRIMVPDEEFKSWITVGDIAGYIDKFIENYGTSDLSEM